MAIDDARRPEFPRGSKEWVGTLSPNNARHGEAITNEMLTATQTVLRGSFSEAAWRGMFVPGGRHSYEKGNSRTSAAIITLMQPLGWSTDSPEFMYVAAQIHVRLAEQVRVPAGRTAVEVYRKVMVEGREERVHVRTDAPPQPADVPAMREEAAAFAAEHDISAERQSELQKIARFPFLSYTKRQTAKDKLLAQDTDGFMEALVA